jgi:anti-sigma-K factor RskA
MNCEELQDLYELYALGVLEEEERIEIEAHLARECPTCTAGVKRARSLNAVIESFAPEVAPDKRLRDRVLASVGANRKQQGFAWWPIWALATAGLAIATLTFYSRSQEVISQLEEARHLIGKQGLDLERSKQILSFLDEPETRQVRFDGKETRPPRGNIFVNRKAGVLLIAQNLPRLESGKTYQMWVIPKGANPKPAGLFQSDESGAALHLMAGPIDVATVGAVAVSVEPSAGSAQPTTTPIIVAPVPAGL